MINIQIFIKWRNRYEGVLALISESTNAERPGSTPSERLVGGHIEEAFRKATGKIFISTFASNVNRVQQVVEAAIKTNRKLALLGRSMVNVVSVAMERGYLNVPDGMLIDARDINQFLLNELLFYVQEAKESHSLHFLGFLAGTIEMLKFSR